MPNLPGRCRSMSPTCLPSPAETFTAQHVWGLSMRDTFRGSTLTNFGVERGGGGSTQGDPGPERRLLRTSLPSRPVDPRRRLQKSEATTLVWRGGSFEPRFPIDLLRRGEGSSRFARLGVTTKLAGVRTSKSNTHAETGLVETSSAARCPPINMVRTSCWDPTGSNGCLADRPPTTAASGPTK